MQTPAWYEQDLPQKFSDCGAARELLHLQLPPSLHSIVLPCSESEEVLAWAEFHPRNSSCAEAGKNGVSFWLHCGFRLAKAARALTLCMSY